MSSGFTKGPFYITGNGDFFENTDETTRPSIELYRYTSYMRLFQGLISFASIASEVEGTKTYFLTKPLQRAGEIQKLISII